MKSKNKLPVYNRLGTVTVEEVLDYVPIKGNKKGLTIKQFFKENVRLTSSRYKVYKIKGVKCVTCNLEGTYFALEKANCQDTKKYHFNLYAINKYGEEIMMTIDHIIPKSKNGLDVLSNKQPMCVKCNSKKGNNLKGVKNVTLQNINYRR